MSSHHIVRAKQEPALILISLKTIDEEMLGQVLEWSPTIMVHREIYEEVDSLGIKIDYVAGAQDHVLQGNTVVLPPGDDELSVFLDHLTEEGYPAVNIIADHIPELPDQYWDALDIVIIHDNQRSFKIKSGFNVWKPAGTNFKIEEVAGLQVNNTHRVNGAFFEVVKDDFVRIEFSAPRIILTELL